MGTSLVLGKHALVDLYGCDPRELDDRAFVESVLVDTATALHCTIVDRCFHKFSPQGVTGVVVIAESHISVHTWPEHGYAAVDMFTCGDPSGIEQMALMLKAKFRAPRVGSQILDRGIVAPTT
jgi:S-adenosylmethionine decarboxylase